MIHIKRDGGWLCGKEGSLLGAFYKDDCHISFSDAHRMDIKANELICPYCGKRYYEIISKLTIPIIIK